MKYVHTIISEESNLNTVLLFKRKIQMYHSETKMLKKLTETKLLIYIYIL